MKYVLIGNGVAAIGAIEGIRQYDSDAEILVISEEQVPTYGRPLISYFLADKIKSDVLPFRSEAFYEDNKVQMKLGTKVVSVDADARELTLSTGDRVPYDKLLIATGGEPFDPGFKGADGPGIFNFTQVAHAEALKELVDSDEVKKVAVVGAGLIALKAAEGFAEKNIPVTLIVRSRIMRAYFDNEASDVIVRHLEGQGLEFVQEAQTKEILRDSEGKVKGVVTDKGFVEADAVIVAAGVTPHTELAEGCGIETRKGIVVNDHMASSNPDVYAAGDVAEARDLLTGEYAVRPIWPNAYNQGLYAGYNMAGADVSYEGGLSMNSITYYGLPTISIGQPDPDGDDCEVHVYEEPENSVYRKVVFRDDVLVGCILIGDIDSAGFYTSYIKNKFKLDEDAKQHLIDGEPSPVHWPDDYVETMQQNP